MNIIDQIDAATGCQQCQGPLGNSVSSDFCSPGCQTAWHAARATPIDDYREPTDLAAHVSNLVEMQSPETTPFGRPTRPPGFPRPPRIPVDTMAAAWGGEHRVRFRALWNRLRHDDMVTLEIDAYDMHMRVEVDRETFARRATAFREATYRIPHYLSIGVPLPVAVEDALRAAGISAQRHRNARMPDDVQAHVWNGDALPGEWVPIGWVDDAEPVTLGFDGSGGDVVAVRQWNGHTHLVGNLPRFEPISFDPDAVTGMFRHFTTGLQHAAAAIQQLGQIAARDESAETRPADRMQAALEARRRRNTGPAAAQRAPRRIDPRRNR